MFNKEESNKTKKVELGKISFKKIGTILLTMTLIFMLSNSVQAETTKCNYGEVEYRDRVYTYNQEREYDEKITKIYREYQMTIDESTAPLEKYYILYNKNSPEGFHLINVSNGRKDVLTNSDTDLQFDSIVRFRDTTAFIILLESDCISIDSSNGIITVTDKEKALNIINNWDGLIHNKVAETDAVENKDVLRRK